MRYFFWCLLSFCDEPFLFLPLSLPLSSLLLLLSSLLSLLSLLLLLLSLLLFARRY
jgi:hypothetical protein